MEGSAPGLRPPTQRAFGHTIADKLTRLVLGCVCVAAALVAVASAWRDSARDAALQTQGLQTQGLQTHGVGATATIGRAQGVLGHLAANAAVDLLATGIAMLAAVLLVRWLQRAVTRPILALTQSMEVIERDHDYGHPVDITSNDEIGELVDGFNRMLSELRSRDRRIASQMAALEAAAAVGACDLASAESGAEASAGAISDVIAALSHEIGTPLSGIMAMAGRLAAIDAPNPQRRLAERIARSGSSVLANIRDIVALSGMEAGGIELKSLPVDLNEVVDDVCGLFWEQASSKGLDLAAYVDPATPRLISGDAMRLRQVIGALVNNAVRSTETGGVLIEVEPDPRPETRLDGRRLLRISVHDTGVGIPKDEIAAVFGTVDQPDPATPRKFVPGLGLAMCKRVVEAMDGRCSVTSDIGRGTTFAFRLPVAEIEAAAPWMQAPSTCGMAVIAHPGRSTRRALARYLSRAGYTVGYPEAGATADRASLVLGAPAMLRAIGPVQTPVVCLAPHGEAESHEMQRSGAAQAVLVQPLQRSELEALLRRRAADEPLQDLESDAPPASGGAQPASTDPETASVGGRDDAHIRPRTEFTAAGMTPDVRALLADLSAALADDALSLVYQPQIDRDSERVIGVEALLRWTHPVRGVVSPGLFIPLAEQHGMIGRVTAWVVDRMLAETRYLTGVQVAFNASALEFADSHFVDSLSALIARHDYDPRRLEVEITETAILQNEGQVRRNMDRLHALGMGIALDDFGAGYSSLGHLRRYPFDKLKIDREFVTDCSRDMQSATVVHAVVSIGRALGMKVIAEGVETDTQRKFLKVAGVHAMQGYLFGDPVSIDGLPALIRSRPLRAQA